MNNNNDFIFTLNFLANICQLADFEMDIKQISNDELLKYLVHQDNDYLKTAVEQNKKIIAQNEEIINLLKGGENA